MVGEILEGKSATFRVFMEHRIDFLPVVWKFNKLGFTGENMSELGLFSLMFTTVTAQSLIKSIDILEDIHLMKELWPNVSLETIKN